MNNHNNVITKESIKNVYRVAADLQLHRQLTGRHTPRTPQNLQKTPKNCLVLNSGYAKVSTLMVGTQQVGGNYNTRKAKTRNSRHGLTAFSNFS